METQGKTLAMAGAVIALQVVDAGLHIAINEVETLRILSNAVLVIGVSLGVFLTRSSRTALWAGAIGYVVLNLVFVALFGLENPVTGVNRAPLFAFMALSLWLSYRLGRLHAKAGAAAPV
ncbi:hypothetical protein [Anianabacter salinae]|uniref:hypothetical protein n=1 Tax=Anianabacter salinae TaxID=2851023 RepID=UPI00225E0D4F|nr:hypothetical protein [Anianabacter salinae]MBV0913814.1 hypothetical protein [Anianabacter salinae]